MWKIEKKNSTSVTVRYKHIAIDCHKDRETGEFTKNNHVLTFLNCCSADTCQSGWSISKGDIMWGSRIIMTVVMTVLTGVTQAAT